MEINFSSTGRMILQLGEELIKNEIIALSELVKNSYDADASNCRIEFNSSKNNNVVDSIIILDNGEGMTEEVIKNSWFVIGGNLKKEKLVEKKVSDKYKRLPIGEKGIGRLGLSKLGFKCTIYTKSKKTNIEYSFSMDWKKFENSLGLKDILFNIKKNETNEILGESGTKIVITELKNAWDETTQKKVIRDLRTLSSPFGGIDNFRISINVPNRKIFEKIKTVEEVVNLALYRAKFTIKENVISKLEYSFTPYKYMEKLKKKEIVLENIPLEFKNKNKVESYDLRRIADLKKIEGELLIYDKAPNILNLLTSEERGGIKDVLSNLGGIKVYRDGNRIYNYGSKGDDWLNIDRERINTPSSKLGNDITLGVIKLKREDSLALEEKTNREGFLENEAYEIFRNVIRIALRKVEQLRNEDKEIMRNLYDKASVQEPVYDAIKKLNTSIDNLEDLGAINKEKLKQQVKKIEEEYKETTELLLRSSGLGLSLSIVIHELEKRINELNIRIHEKKDIDSDLKFISNSISRMMNGYKDLLKDKKPKKIKIKGLIEEALENIMYRLKVHEFIIEKQYLKKDDVEVKLSEALTIGNIVNVIDNSIYWVEKVYKKENKKILIDYFINNNYFNLLIVDSGDGFTIAENMAIKPLVSGKDVGGVGLGLYIANESMKEQKGILKFPSLEDLEEMGIFLQEEYKYGAKVMFSFRRGE